MAVRRGRQLLVGGAVCVALVLCALLLWTGGGTRPGYDGPVKHVIVISLDTTRADHLGCYGNEWIRTPRIDALAAESILLTNYMTVATTTLASHTALFTGKYPHSHGVPRNGFVVNEDNVMLAEILKDAGFVCAGFLGSFALDSRFNFAQGFDHYDETFGILVGAGGADQNQRVAADVTDAVIDWLDDRGADENLFLFVHYFDPHKPYDPPPPYDTMYGVGPGPHDVEIVRHPALMQGPRPPAVHRQLAGYAGEVSYMDEHVGRLLDALKERGILDESLLLVTSDHGENLTDHPGEPFDHGWTVFECESRAVGIIRLPGGTPGGRRIDGLVASVDLLPTLTAHLGLPTPPDVDGAVLDLDRLTTAEAMPTRFCEATKPWAKVETDPRWFNALKTRSARRGSYKFIETRYQQTEGLYDLSTDPHEWTNLLAGDSATIPAEGAALRAALRAWADTARPLPSRFEASQWNETVRRLRSLGYLGGDSAP